MTGQESEDTRPVIVVGYDGSPAARAAVEHALVLAGTTGTLHIVHTYLIADDALAASYRNFADQDAHEAATEVVAALERDEPRLAGVRTRSHVVLGEAAAQLCRIARESDADAIVLGTRGVGRVRGALLGSVAHAVLHEADRPVTVIPDRMLRRRAEAEAAEVA